MTVISTPETIRYPDSDGRPMADNTKQYHWIVTLKGNFDLLFAGEPDVFIAGDLLWYPVEGRPDICTAPDVLVAFDRPKGDRSSYKQWEEGQIAPQVVFEILSPSNRVREMGAKLDFYDQYGVEEYYIYNPDTFDLGVWVRDNQRLHVANYTDSWHSPRLGVSFQLYPDRDMSVFHPDGRSFLSFVELGAARFQAEAQATEAAARAESAEEQNRRMAARLRELGIDPDAL